MKSFTFLLLLLAGSALANEEIDRAGRRGVSSTIAADQNGNSRESVSPSDTKEQTSKIVDQPNEHSNYERKSAFKSSRNSQQFPRLRQRNLLRETQRREKHSGFAAAGDATQFPDHSFSVQNELQSSMQFQQISQSYAQKSSASSAIPLQQQLDRITKLPGQPEVSFAQYAGYVTVNETAGRALFYYFVEATSSPENKPLVLWLNGGPGCSSLGYGAWQELGPFHVKSDGYTLYRNKHSWNKLANFLFLESPAGVGFSYSNDTQDYVTAGDTKTSYDSLVFLTKWFERFPLYKYRDFYITGESYAGHYAPQLVKRVYDFNIGQATPVINLKGFLVGNALIDSAGDARGIPEYYWTHAIISDESYAKLKCLYGYPFVELPDSCEIALDNALIEQGLIDPYDIYVPVCLVVDNSTEHRRFKGRRRFFSGYDPCTDLYITAYFNRPDVQEALHANVTRLDYAYELCNLDLNAYYSDIAFSVIPIYQELVKTGLKIWVMSGDVDSVVPVTSTRYSLQLLKLNTTVPWYAWYLDDYQVAGYTQGYDGLTFVTVRDAGHEIPLTQPARGFALFKSYITGQSLPNITSILGG